VRKQSKASDSRKSPRRPWPEDELLLSANSFTNFRNNNASLVSVQVLGQEGRKKKEEEKEGLAMGHGEYQVGLGNRKAV
jgi:hypothetical protein